MGEVRILVQGHGRTYRYSDWQKGVRYYGGEVAGRIGAMGLADDADDVSYGGYTRYRYRTVEPRALTGAADTPR